MTPARKLAAFVTGLLVALGVGFGVGTFFELGEAAPVEHGETHR